MDVSSSRLVQYKEYFVSNDFGVTENVDDVMKSIYADGILYDQYSC